MQSSPFHPLSPHFASSLDGDQGMVWILVKNFVVGISPFGPFRPLPFVRHCLYSLTPSRPEGCT